MVNINLNVSIIRQSLSAKNVLNLITKKKGRKNPIIETHLKEKCTERLRVDKSPNGSVTL